MLELEAVTTDNLIIKGESIKIELSYNLVIELLGT